MGFLKLVFQLDFSLRRLYFQSDTCLPMKSEHIDINSEDESNPEWMKMKTIQVSCREDTKQSTTVQDVEVFLI